jgi:MFS family permease
LLPPERRGADSAKARPGRTKGDYRQVLTSPAFWIIFIGVILSTMPNSIMMAQMNLILAENMATGKGASLMISAYASGTIFGRLISGAALDRFSAPIVAAIGLAAAGLGVLLLASGFDTTPVVFLAVLIVGLSVGAEGDVIAYLVVRNFGVRLYSTVHSITSTGTAIASVIGAMLLSYTLKQYGLYSPFLGVCGVLAVVASVLFLFLPRNPQVEDELPESVELPVRPVAA